MSAMLQFDEEASRRAEATDARDAGSLRRSQSGYRIACCSLSFGRHLRIAAVYGSNARECRGV